MTINNHNNSGFSIVEIVVALAILVIFSVAIISLVLANFTGWERSEELLQVENLISEAYGATRHIKERAWNEIRFGQSAISYVGNIWQLSGEGTSEQINKFTRIITFSPVFRDSSGATVASTSPGAYNDVLSKEISASINWVLGNGQELSRSRQWRYSAWAAKEWTQSDWSLSDGVATWVADGSYNSQDGNIDDSLSSQIALALVATSTYASQGTLISSAYDTNGSSAIVAISWEESIPGACGTCEVKLQIKTAPDDGGSPGVWTSEWSGPDGIDGDEDDYYSVSTGELIPTDHNGDEWIQYRASLLGDSTDTPILTSVNIFYQ